MLGPILFFSDTLGPLILASLVSVSCFDLQDV